jgi:RHS repeat-associated protein
MLFERYDSCEVRMRGSMILKVLLRALFALWVLAPVASAQIVGQRPFVAPEPVELGFIESATGNIHLEIPLGAFPQRGMNGQSLPFKLIYDSNIWSVTSTGTWSPSSNQFNGSGQLNGWYLGSFDSWGFSVTLHNVFPYNTCGNKYVNYQWTDPAGSRHSFPISTQTSNGHCSGWNAITSGDAFAADSSGYHMYVTNYQDFTVYGPDGTKVFSIPFDPADSRGNFPITKDSNGNYLSVANVNGNPIKFDTTGRAALQINTTCASGSSCYQVLNSENSYSQYTVTTATIHVITAFHQSGVTECITNCSMTVIQSIVLPDNTSYTFNYDCDPIINGTVCGSQHGQNAYYGLLTGITLPTGGQISYGYTTYFNSYGSASRWVNSRTSAGGTWTYTPQVISTCSSSQVGCQQKFTVKRPNGASTVYTFTLNNGAWPTQIQTYDINGTLLATIGDTWDFSNTCPLISCIGAAYIRKTTEKVSAPTPTGTNTKQTTYAYDSPQTGNITAAKEWKFYPGASPSFPSTPDRATYTTYLTTGTNDINRPLRSTVCNNSGSSSNCPGGGGLVAQTLNTYDSNSLQLVSNIANHDDQNFGTGNTARGNLTKIQNWVAASTYLTQNIYYDTTGQVYQALDPAGNPTSFGYSDNYFTDAGSTSPPQGYTPTYPTNAYLTSASLGSQTEKFGYYYGSGKQALFTSPNALTTYSHFFDPFDRPTGSVFPIGWNLTTYSGATETDTYNAVGDATASTACSSCQHIQLFLDAFGRESSRELVNDPNGADIVATNYDSSGRVQNVSHPYTGTSGVYETYAYDGFDRTTGITHPDGQFVQSIFGASVGSIGGLTSQQGSPATYGYAYPVTLFDESGKQKEEWIDGFGKIVEVDEPQPQASGTPATGSITISGTEQEWATNPCAPKGGDCPQFGWDFGTVSITVNGFVASVGYQQGSTSSSVASALAAALNSSSSPVTASVSGSIVSMTSIVSDSTANYSLSTSSSTSDPSHFSSPSFKGTPSGSSLTGGTGTMFGTPMVTLYTYNALNELTTVAQGAQIRTFTYDGLGRRISTAIPEAGPTNLFYTTSGGSLCSGDPGNICRRTDGKGITTTYSYDTLGRLTSKTYSDTTPPMSFTYDQGGAAAYALGFLTQMTDGSGSETYTYDQAGRLKQLQKVIGTATYTISYQFNPGGEVTQITYPSGHIVRRSYDVIGQLCEVASQTAGCGTSASPYATGFGYNPAGQVTGFKYGNGVAASFAFSPSRSQLTSLSYTQGTQTLFGLNYFYQFDSTNCKNPNANGSNNSQIQCIADLVNSGRSVSYAYDRLLRLNTAATNGSTGFPQWGMSWVYDQYYNRSAQNVSAGAAPMSSLSFNVANHVIGDTYDADGNLTIEALSPPNMYSYDAENNLTTFQGGSGSASYTYDGNGLRVKETRTGGATTVFIFSGSKDIAEYDNGAAPGSPSREYIYSNGTLLAQIATGSIQYFHQDHLSVRVITDGTPSSPTYGQVISQQGHFPFGELWYQSGTTTNWIFTSYNRDTGESGLDYAIARFYNSRRGGFCSVDPLEGWPADPLSWNKYSYVENDPINLRDPSGKGWLQWLVDAILILISVFTGDPSTGIAILGDTGGLTVQPWIFYVLPSVNFAAGQLEGQQSQQGPTLPPPAPQFSQGGSKPAYCAPNIMAGIQAAWTAQQTANMQNRNNPGKTSAETSEGTFAAIPKSGGGYKDPNIQVTSGEGKGTINIAGATATFHTHNNGGLPSTPTTAKGGEGDTGNAVKSNIDTYVISDEGLALAPATGPRQPPKGWDPWIVQGKNIKDWLAKLKAKCKSL